MEAIIDEIRATLNCGIYYPVVATLLMLPDACGTAEFYGTGTKPSDRYVQWYDRWVYPHYNSSSINFDGSVVYRIRNALMHETTGFVRGVDGFDRVLFNPPSSKGIIDRGRMQIGEEQVFIVAIESFLAAVEKGLQGWLDEIRADEDPRRLDAVSKLLQLRPEGLPPFVNGFPIIA